MQISDLFITATDGLDARRCRILEEQVAPVDGIYQTYFDMINKGCHGLRVRYDPNMLRGIDLLERLYAIEPDITWRVCRPDVDCPRCTKYGELMH